MKYEEKYPYQEFKYLAPDGISYDGPREYVLTGKLGFCGCFSDHLADHFFELLEHLVGGKYGYEYSGSEDITEIFLHLMDNMDWVEHGGNIRGSWITAEGKKIAELCEVSE